MLEKYNTSPPELRLLSIVVVAYSIMPLAGAFQKRAWALESKSS